jgi:hypothetical protein
LKESKMATSHTSAAGRPRGILVVALLMILFGLAEVVTGFTHDFFGITTSSTTLFTYSSAVIGLMYAAAGFLILTTKRWAAVLAIVLLCADIAGRVALVVAGLFPTDSLKNTLSIIPHASAPQSARRAPHPPDGPRATRATAESRYSHAGKQA